MTKNYDPQSACLPGGSCPDCNEKPPYCPACGEHEVLNKGDLCGMCQALRADDALSSAAEARALLGEWESVTNHATTHLSASGRSLKVRARAWLSASPAPAPSSEPPSYDMSLHYNPDASAWAKEFVRVHGGDEGLMLGWFANAMMAMHDHLLRPAPSSEEAREGDVWACPARTRLCPGANVTWPKPIPEGMVCVHCGLPAPSSAGAREERLRSLGFSDERAPDSVGNLIGLAPSPSSAAEERCPDDCMACSGEACRLCGAGCWNNSERNCQHDVIDRHRAPPSPSPAAADEGRCKRCGGSRAPCALDPIPHCAPCNAQHVCRDRAPSRSEEG